MWKKYNSIIKDELLDKSDKDYYDKLKYSFGQISYLLFKEIKKITNIDYCYKILEKLLDSNGKIKIKIL